MTINTVNTEKKEEAPKENKYLKRVLDSAFDFLETGISQFENQPKYSVINFCSGIELILKAKLMDEHWSLVVNGEPDLNEFKSGKSKTANFIQLIPRIRKVTGEKISDEIEDCFKKIAAHRNKVTHFFHEAYTPDGSKELRKNIVVEQRNAWEYLNKLFDKWGTIFNPYIVKIATLDAMMQDQKRQIYLKEKFEQVKDTIEQEKKTGTIYKECTSCRYPASQETKLTDVLFEYECKVCERSEVTIKIICYNCNELIDFNKFDFEKDEFICPDCFEAIEKKYIIDVIDTDPTTKDNYFDKSSINCTFCGSNGSVVTHEDYYICTECLSIGKDVQHCSWCGEGQLGGSDLNDSYECGCESCDGHIGWHSGDSD